MNPTTGEPSLADELNETAAELADVQSQQEPDGVTQWSRGGRAFAAVADGLDEAWFDLDPAVAAAALRTPDTTSSQRGPGWVTFRPPTLDRFARDRARAWFESAWRRTAR